MYKSGCSLFALAVLLTACGEAPEEEKEQIDYSLYDNAAVQELFDAGDYQQVFTIVREQEALGITDKDDYLILCDVFLSLLNGVAAEVAIEKAVEEGAEEIEVALKLARAFMLQRKFDDALATIGEVVLTGDKSYEALLLRGDIHRELNEDDRARHFFNSAIEDQPDNYRGYLGMALLELNLGNLERAEELANKSSEYIAEDAIVSYVKGTTARYLLRAEEAIDHLEKAVSLHPAHVLANLELAGIYIDKQDFETAQKFLDEVYAIAPEHPLARYHSSLILASEGKTEEAEELLLRIGDLTRDFPPASRVYGHVAFQLGKFSAAQPYLQRFLEMVPEDRITRLALAESLSRRGEPEKALQILSPVLKDGTDDLAVYMQAAAAAGLSGELIQARDYISRAKQLAETSEGADREMITALGKRLALTRFMTGDLEKAAEQLRALYNENPQDFTSLTLLANLQMEGGDVEGAAETIAEIAAIEPDEPLTLNLQGAVNFRRGNIDEAIAYYSSAIEKNPDYLSALKNRGLAFVVTRQFEQALPDLQKVIETVSDDAHVHGMIGRTYLELGNIDKAVEHLTEAETVFPRSPLVLSDHSEALAAKGFMQSAITKAKQARVYASDQPDFVEYLDGVINGWETAEADRKAAEAAEEERLREEYRQAQAAREKERQEKMAAEEAALEDKSETSEISDEPDNDDEETDDDDPPKT